MDENPLEKMNHAEFLFIHSERSTNLGGMDYTYNGLNSVKYQVDQTVKDDLVTLLKTRWVKESPA